MQIGRVPSGALRRPMLLCAGEVIDVITRTTDPCIHPKMHNFPIFSALLCSTFGEQSRNNSETLILGHMEILIVGAGLGGLAAACCFAKDGHHVQGSRRPAETTSIRY